MNAAAPAHGGDRVAAALAAHGVRFAVHALRRAHLADPRRREGARHPRRRHARRGDRGVRRRRGGAAHGHARRRRGHRRARASPTPSPRSRTRSSRSRRVVLLGGAAPTALQGRGALQDIDQRPLDRAAREARAAGAARARPRRRRSRTRFAVAREGVPGPVFVECPVDLLYDEASIRAVVRRRRRASGTSIADRLLRWYLNRHVERMFAGSARAVGAAARGRVAGPRGAATGAVARAAAALAARRAAAAGRRQPGARRSAAEAPRSSPSARDAARRAGLPVGHGARPARPRAPAADAPRAPRGAARSRLRAARRRALRLPPRLRPPHAARGHARSRPTAAAREARLNRRPTIAAIGDAGAVPRAARRRASASGARREPGSTSCARATPSARPRSTRRRGARRASTSTRSRFFRAIDRSGGRGRRLRRRRRRLRRHRVLHPAPAQPARVARSRACSARSASARASRSARRSRGPKAEVWLLCGDGACGYSLAEFDTFVRHGIPVIAVVGNDAGWTQIAREQVKMLHDDVGTVLARTAYHEVAEGFGAEGIEVRDASRGRAAPCAARASSRPPASRCSSTSGSTRPNSAKVRSRCRRGSAYATRAAFSPAIFPKTAPLVSPVPPG